MTIQTKNILLTGGRAPATLDLARQFSRAGHNVTLAESVRHSLTSYSSAVQRTYSVSSPRQSFKCFKHDLLNIIKQEAIDLLVPTCEEVFWVARAYEELSEHCQVFTQSLHVLNKLHNKFCFIQLVEQTRLPSLDSFYITSENDLHRLDKNSFVLKPVYSRFASQVSLPPHDHFDSQELSRQAWVAQQFVEGRTLCSYSLANDGTVNAHCAYAVDFTAGQGSSVVFQSIDHEPCLNWVRTFVKTYQLGGQLAFDFIEAKDGTLYALECNPRATSGIHLFKDELGFTEAFFERQKNAIFPNTDQSVMLATAMLLQSLPKQKTWANFQEWLKVFGASRDALFDWHDPLPALVQPLSMLPFIERAILKKRTFLQASTFDIEWNGEDKPDD